MTVNGLHLLLALLAATAITGWVIDARRARRAERQVRLAHTIAAEKGRRLMVALEERDAARAHADDAQWTVDAMAAARRHPSGTNVRVLRAVEEQA